LKLKSFTYKKSSLTNIVKTIETTEFIALFILFSQQAI